MNPTGAKTRFTLREVPICRQNRIYAPHRGRYTLWTGDLGIALYLADCVDGGGKLPLP
jgi:hypothetical protein